MKLLLNKYIITIIHRKTRTMDNRSTITPKDVIEAYEKHGNVLTWKEKGVRDLRKMNPKSKFDVSWVPIEFVPAKGSPVPCNLHCSNQIISSSAKAPQSKDEDDDISNFAIQFKAMTREDIAGGDYVPRVMDSPELQEAENARVNRNIDEYVANNVEMIRALDILNESFIKLAEDIIAAGDRKELSFSCRKDRKKDPHIYSIKQSTRYDSDKKEDVPLEAPIFRIKLPVHKPDGRIGYFSKFKNAVMPIVFDARKMTKKNGFKPVPATVKIGNKSHELDRKNVSEFITYKSLITCVIKFDTATFSKAGVSFGNRFHEMFIVRHKSAMTRETITPAAISSLRGGLGSDDEGSDVEIDESKDKAKAKNAGGDSTDDDAQHAPEDNDTSDGEAIDGADDPPSDDDKPAAALREEPAAAASQAEEPVVAEPTPKKTRKPAGKPPAMRRKQ